MIDSDMIYPNENRLSLKEIDTICQDITSRHLLFRDYLELHVHETERNNLIDPSWEYKMELLGTKIQQHMN